MDKVGSISDERLLQCYWTGWDDELKGTTSLEYNHELENKAYRSGASDALIGDEVYSNDSRTEEEILKSIRA